MPDPIFAFVIPYLYVFLASFRFYIRHPVYARVTLFLNASARFSTYHHALARVTTDFTSLFACLT